jgi:replication factor A3
LCYTIVEYTITIDLFSSVFGTELQLELLHNNTVHQHQEEHTEFLPCPPTSDPRRQTHSDFLFSYHTAMSESTPRINARYLEAFTHHTVRIVGRVAALHGETATLEAEGAITIHLNRVRPCSIDHIKTSTLQLTLWKDSYLKADNAAEVIGKVQPDLSVKVFQASDFGSNFGRLPSTGTIDGTRD